MPRLTADKFIGLLVVYVGLAFVLWGASGGEVGVSSALIAALAALALVAAAALMWWASLATFGAIVKMVRLTFVRRR